MSPSFSVLFDAPVAVTAIESTVGAVGSDSEGDELPPPPPPPSAPKPIKPNNAGFEVKATEWLPVPTDVSVAFDPASLNSTRTPSEPSSPSSVSESLNMIVPSGPIELRV